MSPLRRRLEEYLSVRRALGFKLEREGRILPDFLTYLEERKAHAITTELAMNWAGGPSGANRDRAARRLSVVRIFARHMKAIDPQTEVPPARLWPCRVHRTTPYLYSQDDIVRMIEAAGKLRPPLRAATYTMLLGLLAVTGMRVGEAIRLDRQDVDYHQGLLVIHHSKFDKSREVPVHSTTAQRLRTSCLSQVHDSSITTSSSLSRLSCKTPFSRTFPALPDPAFMTYATRSPSVRYCTGTRIIWTSRLCCHGSLPISGTPALLPPTGTFPPRPSCWPW